MRLIKIKNGDTIEIGQRHSILIGCHKDELVTVGECIEPNEKYPNGLIKVNFMGGLNKKVDSVSLRTWQGYYPHVLGCKYIED